MSALQRRTAQLWLGLGEMCGPGSLLLLQKNGLDELALGLACLGRGGALLLLTGDAGSARHAAKVGAVDFVVDTLDEALRILKNELRQRRPVGVALTGDAVIHSTAILLRGVQPQFVAAADAPATWTTLINLGAKSLDISALAERADSLARGEGCSLAEHMAVNGAERRQEDSRLLESMCLPGPGQAWSAPLQWMKIAPRLFPRERERVYWLKRFY